MGGFELPKSDFVVADLLALYGGELLADFREFYQLDLTEVYRGSLSTAVVAELVVQLPDRSRTKCRMQGGKEFVGWDYDRYIQVGIFDALRGLQWIMANQNAKKRSRPPEPTPVPTKPVKKENYLNSMFSKMLKEGNTGGG